MDVAERLKALSTAMLDSTNFLLLRNSLRHQFLRSSEISGLVAQAGEGGQLASSVMSVLRNGSAAGANIGSSGGDGCVAAVSIPSVFVEGVGQTAIDFAMKAFTNSSNANVALTQQLHHQNGEQRQLLASRMHRDAMIWTARGFDTQLRGRIHRQRRSRPPSPPLTQAVSQSTAKSTSGHLSAQIPPPPPSSTDNNAGSTDALHFIVNAAQREWRALINVRVESLKILAMNPSLRSSRSVPATTTAANNDGTDQEGSSASPRSASSGAAPALTSDDLLNICLERGNAAVVGAMKRRATAAAAHSTSTQPNHIDTHKGGNSVAGGTTTRSPVQVENLGYFSSFHSSIVLIFQEANLIPTISDLREALSELDPAAGPARANYNHHGVSTAPLAEDLFTHLIESGDRPDLLCHSVLRRGVPPSLRRLVYAKLLHLPLSLSPASTGALAASNVTGGCRTRRIVRFATANAAKALAESAQQGRSSQSNSGDPALQARQLIRQMVASDASSRIGDSDKYFLFLDECTAVATALLEDSNIADYHLKRQVEQHGGDVAAYLSSNISPSGMRVPTCGVMPFSSSASVVAPLSYITGDLCEMYELAAAMQGQIWSPVQSATPEMFAMLILFERLTAHFAPAAVFHCHTKLSFSLLNVSFKWMVTGFSELFEPAQVLEAWDLLVGVNAQNFFGPTNSKNAAAGAAMPYWVLAAIAASVVVFRAPLVQQAFSQFQVHRLFDDCVKLSPVLLLQQMLFLL